MKSRVDVRCKPFDLRWGCVLFLHMGRLYSLFTSHLGWISELHRMDHLQPWWEDLLIFKTFEFLLSFGKIVHLTGGIDD
jgi:hypothetical protein